MFKLVVLSALLAVVAAAPAPAPGYVHALAAPAVAYAAVPAAVSHQSRVDIHSKPVIATYAAPALVHAAPIAVAHHAPLVSVAAHPVAYSAGIIGAPAFYAHHGAYGVHPY